MKKLKPVSLLAAGVLAASSLANAEEPPADAPEPAPRIEIVDLGGGVELRMVVLPVTNPDFEPLPVIDEPDPDLDALFDDSGRSDDDEKLIPLWRHAAMSETEITQAQWEAVMGTTIREQRDKMLTERDPRELGSYVVDMDGKKALNGSGPDLPMYYVSWREAMEFCRRLSQKTGAQYRLPNELEWEYCARAGAETPYAFGDDITEEQVAFDPNPYVKKAPLYVEPAAARPANAFGLRGVHGNVSEWCLDGYEGFSRGDIEGWSMDGLMGEDDQRAIRGGSRGSAKEECRLDSRSGADPGDRYAYTGFRVIQADTPFPIHWRHEYPNVTDWSFEKAGAEDGQAETAAKKKSPTPPSRRKAKNAPKKADPKA